MWSVPFRRRELLLRKAAVSPLTRELFLCAKTTTGPDAAPPPGQLSPDLALHKLFYCCHDHILLFRARPAATAPRIFPHVGMAGFGAGSSSS